MLPAARSDLDLLLRSLPGTVQRGHTVGAAHDVATVSRLSSGFDEIDALLDGGLPRGQLTELVGPPTSGVTTLVYRLAALVTRSLALVAWVDAADALDPASGAAAGIDFTRILWVRPQALSAALGAAEALLGTAGFALILLDLRRARPFPPAPAADSSAVSSTTSCAASAPVSAAPLSRRAKKPVHAWLRLARAAARSRSVFIVLPRWPGREGRSDFESQGAGANAALRLELQSAHPIWDGNPKDQASVLLDGLQTRVVVTRSRGTRPGRTVAMQLP